MLSSLGMTPAMVARLASVSGAGGGHRELMRVTEVHRESLRLHDGIAEHSARALPRLVRSLLDEGTALAVGDWTFVAEDEQRQSWICERVPPLSHIVRRDGDGRRHPVVSNVDTALLVMGLDDDYNPRRLERYLALIHGDAIQPVVVLTKADIAAPTPDALDARIDALRGRIPAHVDIVAVNATDPSAAAALRSYAVRGQTLVLLGSSGAGKSTLTNTLLGANVQDTGAVRLNDGRGKHTTTSRSLHRLPGGACVIDTPGLRTLRPDVDEAALADTFADVATLAAQCRFRDCRHGEEPGCAVREGVDADRLRNYRKLLREARRDTLSALDRQRQLAQWKARGRATRARMKIKRGESD
ncbi:MAG TPA: ribosome small subunit-dependent GTPase A [Casimicrobiaceae bacterium]|nr:ribosome small subunit-dependent GTPase A [Casimicrobiaceae bacterium]